MIKVETFSTVILDIEYEIKLEIEFSLEPAQNGGLTDPSWGEYWYADSYDLISVKKYREEENSWVNVNEQTWDEIDVNYMAINEFIDNLAENLK